MTHDALTYVAKKVGMTMHGYINANKDTIFEVVYESGIVIVFNELPSGYIKYDLLTH